MVILIVVFGGISIFCFVNGHITTGIICLFSFAKHGVGLLAIIITSISLFLLGYWIVGIAVWIPTAWNIIGIKLLTCKDMTWGEYFKAIIKD